MAVGCTALTQPRPSYRSVAPVNQAIESTVVLLGKQSAWKWRGLICAAVYVGPHYVLTAHHCAVPAAFGELDQIEAEDSGEELDPIGQEVRFVNRATWIKHEDEESPTEEGQIKGMVIADDPANDLALIDTSARAPAYVIPADYDPLVSQEVFTIGHPSGISYSYSKGYISNPVRSLGEDSPDYTQVNLAIWHGNSGGGLFDTNGRLVGICSAMHPRQPTIAFFVSIRPIRAMLMGVLAI